MKVNFDEIENAFEFVSAGPQYEQSAVIDKLTGKIYYQSEMTGIDEFPKDLDNNIENYIFIPHKNDLDLGKQLVFDFCAEFLEDEINEVYHIFSRKGAYHRFKILVDSKGLLDKWYNYENEKKKSALLNWCKDNHISISG